MLEASGQWFVVRLLHCLDPLQDDNGNDRLKTMNNCLVFCGIVVMDVFKPPRQKFFKFSTPLQGRGIFIVLVVYCFVILNRAKRREVSF